MTTTSRLTTQAHLWSIATHWPHLEEALATRGQTWPPLMGIATLSRRDQDEEQAEAARHRAAALRALERSADQPGWAAAPLRLGILDTMTTVEAGLVELADQVASDVQHAPVTPPRPRRTWPANPKTYRTMRADTVRRALLATEQAQDSRRWRIGPGTRDRDARRAALWLLARNQAVPGPFQPLDEEQRARIAGVARVMADLVEHTLDIGDETARLAAACPDCAGPLDMHGGAGALPVVRCTECGRTWTHAQ